jgi:hypothetical protein
MRKLLTKSFEMTWDQIDAIVVGELKDSYERSLTLEKDESGQYIDPDWELLDALEKVLAHFMPMSEYEVWKRNAALQKLTLTSELMGGYSTDEDEK